MTELRKTIATVGDFARYFHKSPDQFERLLAELEIELWIGNAAAIQRKRVRKQKTDRQDTQLILK